MTRYWCERAWLGSGRLETGVLVTITGARFAGVEASVLLPPSDAERLPGLTLPGLANCHSHAFHRALRGRTQTRRGSFWTWRQQMYAVAERLDPESYYRLARATYAEMALAGITCVGEFHYLHHGLDGTPYDEPNAMGAALITAAQDAGIRITLLDTCYLTGAIGRPLEGAQQRFGDGDAERWGSRAGSLHQAFLSREDVVIGAAVHSVRAVPRDDIGAVGRWAQQHQAPLHMHVSEQRAENAACLAAYGRTPVELLSEQGALGRRSSAVHATHLSESDVRLLGGSAGQVCLCPTTERDLGDGIGPARQLAEAGAVVTLGSDSHAVVDLFEEMRAVEMGERLVTERRGHWAAEELLTAATATGHASLGFTDAGVIVAGARADLVTVDLRSPRTAGTGGGAETAVFAAAAADVTDVVCGGRRIVREGKHALLDVGAELARVIEALA